MNLKQRVPLFRWSFWRMAAASANITRTGQIGDGREAAAVDYVLAHAHQGDIDSVLDTIDRFAYDESFLINIGDEKGELLDAAVRPTPAPHSNSAPTVGTAHCASPGPHRTRGCSPSNSRRPTR